MEIGSGDRYEGNFDIGNMYKGDGEKFKGRGPIQLTGRYNYRECGKTIGLDLEENPDVVADDPATGFKCAMWFWNTRNLNSWADQNTKEAFDQVTQIVNGCVTCPFTN